MTTERKQMTVVDAINNRKTEYQALLVGSGVNIDKFVKNSIMATTKHPEINKGEVSIRSCMEVINRACMDQVELDGREAALVIGWNGRTKQKEAQYRLMAQGVMKMIGRAPEIKFIACQVMYENDIKELSFVTDDCPLKHEIDFSKPDRGQPIGAYVIAKLKSGEWTSPEYMSKAEIDAVRDKFSKKDKDGKFSMMWENAWGEAARKTVLHRAKKRLPLSQDVIDNLEKDEEAELSGTGEFIDNATGEISTDVPDDAAKKPRQTRAAAAVKAAVAEPQPHTEDVIDAEHTDLTEEPAEQPQEIPDDELPM